MSLSFLQPESFFLGMQCTCLIHTSICSFISEKFFDISMYTWTFFLYFLCVIFTLSPWAFTMIMLSLVSNQICSMFIQLIIVSTLELILWWSYFNPWVVVLSFYLEGLFHCTHVLSKLFFHYNCFCFLRCVFLLSRMMGQPFFFSAQFVFNSFFFWYSKFTVVWIFFFLLLLGLNVGSSVQVYCLFWYHMHEFSLIPFLSLFLACFPLSFILRVWIFYCVYLFFYLLNLYCIFPMHLRFYSLRLW